jgi:DNA-binding IclR family transcriptional regulator
MLGYGKQHVRSIRVYMGIQSSGRCLGNQPYDKVLAVLDVVASWARPITISEIAQQTGLPLPTVHRLATQLEYRGLLKRQIAGKRYLVGSALTRLSAKVLNAAFSADKIRSELTSLARKIGEHCHLGVNLFDEITYVETARAEQSSGLFFAQGQRSPLHGSSTGKLFLAELTEEELDSWLSRTPRKKLTKQTLTAALPLKREIKATQQRGWARSNEELVDGVVGCAVPIRDRSGLLLAGLGVSAPQARVAFEDLAQLVPSMELTAKRIALHLEQKHLPSEKE